MRVFGKVVDESGTEGILKTPGLHYLLLSALLEPEALGIPHLEDQSCRLIALQAKVKPALYLDVCGPGTMPYPVDPRHHSVSSSAI